jgi:hypothetical protein
MSLDWGGSSGVRNTSRLVRGGPVLAGVPARFDKLQRSAGVFGAQLANVISVAAAERVLAKGENLEAKESVRWTAVAKPGISGDPEKDS